MTKLRLAALLVSLSLGTAVRAEDLTEVGLAKVDITPEYPVRLTGYQARTKLSEGVDHRLYAKALAIGSDVEKPALIVTVDNLGVSGEMLEEVAARLAKETGLERSRFTISSSHTHSAPVLKGVANHIFAKDMTPEELETVERYTRELVDKIELVSVEALQARKPGRLAWTQGSVDFAFNRRTKGGPVDHALPVLKVTDPDGVLRGVLVNYACHCTTIDPRVNKLDGDWAGYAQDAIETDHPGAIALTAIGCGADSNPKRPVANTVESAKTDGLAVANEVKRLLDGDWKALTGAPSTALKSFKLPFDTPPTRDQLEALVKKGGAEGYNASVILKRLEKGIPVQTELDYSVQAWWFGNDLAMVFLPGEVVVDYVLRLKKEYDPSRLWVSAYSNDLPCYIPSERILKEGGYEGAGAMHYYARPTRLKTGVEALIIDAVHDVLPKSFAATP